MAIETKTHSRGNSQGVRIPKRLHAEVGLEVGDQLSFEPGAGHEHMG